LFVGVVIEDADVAAGALADAFEDFDGGGFAGAVGSEKAEDFTCGDLEIEAAHGFEGSVVFGEAGYQDGQRLGHKWVRFGLLGLCSRLSE